MKIVFATNNKYKFLEIKKILPESFILLSLNDLNLKTNIPESFDTLEENAIEKAKFIYDKFEINCFADDTGLEIDALNGEPGAFSARYAGKNCSFNDNIDKVLEKMKNLSNRKASFRTIIAYLEEGKIYTFEGKVDGIILHERKGSAGFGYDPVFQPSDYTISFAEMNLDEKNKISHRAKAVSQFVEFITERRKNL